MDPSHVQDRTWLSLIGYAAQIVVCVANVLHWPLESYASFDVQDRTWLSLIGFAAGIVVSVANVLQFLGGQAAGKSHLCTMQRR